MQPITVSVGPIASASANNIALSQTAAGAADLTLNGALVTSGVAVLDKPRRVLITNVGNDLGITFTVYGTTFGGQTVSETVTGTSGSTVATSLDFATVTRIATSGATSASGVTVGTNGVAGSRWVRLDNWADAQTSIQCAASGTVNYTIQVTMDDPNSAFNPVSPASVVWNNTSDTAGVGASASIYSNFAFTPLFARVLLNSGTGSVSGTFAQFNAVNK